MRNNCSKNNSDMQSEEKTFLLDNISVQAWILKDSENYIWANKAHAEFMGRDRKELVNKNIYEVLSKDEAEVCIEGNKTVYNTKKEIKTEELVEINGEKHLLSIIKTPKIDDKGHVKFIVCRAYDITEKKKIKEDLIKSQKIYQSVVEDQTDLICRFLPDGRLIYVNNSYCKYFGMDNADLKGKNFFDFLLENEKEYVLKIISSINIKNPVKKYEHRVIDCNGKIRWQHWIDRGIFNENGDLTEIQSVGRDITEIKKIEEKLRNAYDEIELKVIERTKELEKANNLLKRRYEAEKVLSQVSSDLLSTSDVEKSMNDSLKKMGKIFEACKTYIYLECEEDRNYVSYSYEWCDEGVPSQIGKIKRVHKDNISWWIKKLQEGDFFYCKDYSTLPSKAKETNELLINGKSDIKSLIILPLRIGKKSVGIIGFVNMLETNKWNEEDINILHLFAEAIGNVLDRKKSEEKLEESNIKLQKLFKGTVDVLCSAIELKDPYTAGHQKRVAELACVIAKEMNLEDNDIEGLRIAALLHDIGKIYIPSSILSKPSKLTKNELNLVKDHCEIGYRILKKVDFPWPIAKIVSQHHERMNGSGYPNNLKGEEICLEARILAVADVVEAISSHRPYRPALGIRKALEEIIQNSGVLYDSAVVNVCKKIIIEKGFMFKD